MDSIRWIISDGQSQMDDLKWTISDGQIQIDNLSWTVSDGQYQVADSRGATGKVTSVTLPLSEGSGVASPSQSSSLGVS